MWRILQSNWRSSCRCPRGAPERQKECLLDHQAIRRSSSLRCQRSARGSPSCQTTFLLLPSLKPSQWPGRSTSSRPLLDWRRRHKRSVSKEWYSMPCRLHICFQTRFELPDILHKESLQALHCMSLAFLQDIAKCWHICRCSRGHHPCCSSPDRLLQHSLLPALFLQSASCWPKMRMGLSSGQIACMTGLSKLVYSALAKPYKKCPDLCSWH